MMKQVKSSRRIVIKVGTRLLSDSKMNLDKKSLEIIIANVLSALNKGKSVVLVTSGAIGAGMAELGYKRRPQSIIDKQVCAAVGQSILMHEYEKAFSEHEIITGQVLLTRADITDRKRRHKIRQVMERLLEKKVLPIVNENDVTADDEIKFGDNDTLAGLVTELIDAETLIILTDVDGLFDSLETKRKISVITKIGKEHYSTAGSVGGETSVGGMTTKLKTAEKMARAGRITIIASGRVQNTVEKILQGENTGTLILPLNKKIEARKRWISDHLISRGQIIVDAGAVDALIKKGSSLLPKGIIEAKGEFDENCVIEILDENKNIIGQGLTSYSSNEVNKIKQRKSSEITAILGFSRGEEVIHRDNMVINK